MAIPCPDHEKFQYKCRECCRCNSAAHYAAKKEEYSLKHKAWYEKNKESHKHKTKGHSRKRLFGIDQEQFDLMLVDQQHRCLLCDTQIDQSAHVDHCHATGKVRGLLCAKCNLGLGLFKDNPAVLIKAAAYVQRNNE